MEVRDAVGRVLRSTGALAAAVALIFPVCAAAPADPPKTPVLLLRYAFKKDDVFAYRTTVVITVEEHGSSATTTMLSDGERRGVAFLVRRAIAQRGLRARRFFAAGLKQAQAVAPALFERAVKNLARRLSDY